MPPQSDPYEFQIEKKYFWLFNWNLPYHEKDCFVMHKSLLTEHEYTWLSNSESDL